MRRKYIDITSLTRRTLVVGTYTCPHTLLKTSLCKEEDEACTLEEIKDEQAKAMYEQAVREAHDIAARKLNAMTKTRANQTKDYTLLVQLAEHALLNS